MSTQFTTLSEAAVDCDVIVGANALQIAAPSIAELRGIPYFHVSYCPQTLPSTHHAPLPGMADTWTQDAGTPSSGPR